MFFENVVLLQRYSHNRVHLLRDTKLSHGSHEESVHLRGLLELWEVPGDWRGWVTLCFLSDALI